VESQSIQNDDDSFSNLSGLVIPPRPNLRLSRDSIVSTSPGAETTELPPINEPNANEAAMEIRRQRRHERLTRYSSAKEMVNIQSQYVFADFAPQIFAGIRKLSGISKDDYLRSLNPQSFLGNLDNQKFSEGKSGSFFCFSPDKNFILKTITAQEANLLKKLLLSYYKHLISNPKSYLTRLYGLYSVTVQGTIVIYCIVMSNLFNTKRKIHEKYDIKGSWVSRSVKEHDVDPSVLGKDTDMKRKLKLKPEDKAQLISTMTKDVMFLASYKIMDYSLLLGYHFLDSVKSDIEKQAEVQLNDLDNKPLSLINEGILSSDNKEIYFVGLIDILQLFDLNKKMERCCKIYFLRKKKDGLSVQPINVYADRFIKNLDKIIE